MVSETTFKMLRRPAKFIDAVLILWVAMVCVALVAAPTRALDGLQLFASGDEVDPLEGADAPEEDSIEFGSVPTRARTRQEDRHLSDAGGISFIRICSATIRPRSLTAADIAGALIGRNGCGAILRC